MAHLPKDVGELLASIHTYLVDESTMEEMKTFIQPLEKVLDKYKIPRWAKLPR